MIKKNWGAWNRKFPIGELRKLKHLPASDGDLNDLEALISLFGISLPDKSAQSLESITGGIQANEK